MKLLQFSLFVLLLNLGKLSAVNVVEDENNAVRMLVHSLVSNGEECSKDDLGKLLLSEYREQKSFSLVFSELGKRIAVHRFPPKWGAGLHRRSDTITVFLEAPLESTPRLRISAIFSFDETGDIVACKIATSYLSD